MTLLPKRPKTLQQLFTERARTRREDLGWSQRFFAAQLGITQATVSNWERGRHSPTLDDTAAIAQILGLDLREMLKT